MTLFKSAGLLAFVFILCAGSPSANATTPPQSAVETAFLSALEDIETGQPRKAIPVLVSILARNPSLVRVRLELARAYFNAEDWRRARQEFFIVLSADLPEAVRLRVLAFIRAIDSRRGFDWDLSLSVVKVGNQRRYKSDTVLVESGGTILPFRFDREVSSAFGLRANGALNFRHPLSALSSDKASLVGFATLGFDITDAKSNTYDDAIFSLTGGLRVAKNVLTYSIAPTARTRYIAGSKYEDRFGLLANFERRGVNGGSIFGGASYFKLENNRDNSLSGKLTAATLGLRQAISGRAIIGVSGRIEREDVPNALANALTSQVTLSSTIEMKYGLTARPSLYFRYKDFRTPSPLLPANPNEKTYGVRLRLEKNDWFIAGSYTPFVEFTYEDTKSDIAAFSYTEMRSHIGITRRF